MSIGFAGLHLMLPALKALAGKPDARIVVLGTMDLLFTRAGLEDFLRRQGVPFVPVPEAETRTTNSFGAVSHEDWHKFRGYLHQDTLFRMLGFDPGQVRTLDVDDYEHADLLHDLNVPVPPALGQFDLILDLGTLEHIFDVRQALWNLSDLCKTGGQVIHMAPVNFLAHGFYNFSAILFADYYQQAGWTKEQLFYALFPPLDGLTTLYATLDPEKLPTIPDGFFINVVAVYRKPAGAIKPIAVQNLYLGLHAAWKTQSRKPEAERPPSQRPAWRVRLDAARLALKRQWALQRIRALGGRPVDLG